MVADPAVVLAVRVAAPALRIIIEYLPRFSTRGADSAVPLPLFIAALPDSADQHHGENHYSWYHFWYHSFKVVRKTANKTRHPTAWTLVLISFLAPRRGCALRSPEKIKTTAR